MLANPHAYPLGHSDFLSGMGVLDNTFTCSCLQYSWESPSTFSFVIVLTSLSGLDCRTALCVCINRLAVFKAKYLALQY